MMVTPLKPVAKPEAKPPVEQVKGRPMMVTPLKPVAKPEAKTPAKPPAGEEDQTVRQWRRIMVWLGLITAGIVVFDVIVTMRFMRVPDAQPAADARIAVAAARARPPLDVLPAETAPPDGAAPAATNAEPAEVREQHLAAQAESLRRESEENANSDSLLALPKERVEQLIREGREIY